MAGMYGISSYQKTDQAWRSGKKEVPGQASKTSYGVADPKTAKSNGVSDIRTKDCSFIESTSSLVPRQTEYGNTIGDVKLSDKAKAYYDKLKARYHNIEFIAVSKDLKAQVHANAASYGNANKMVLLIDDEKLERMATDEAYRKKYEAIIAMSEMKLSEAKNSLASTGIGTKNFGVSVDSNGNESFFATVEKSLDAQKKSIEKKAAQKKELKAKEKKKAEKELREERLKKAAEENVRPEELRDRDMPEADTDGGNVPVGDNKEYVTIEASSMEELISMVSSYSYDIASRRVMSGSDTAVGAHIDFRG
ncbi:MAG: DUF6033 family protein [Lachnospiraceae bacterium]|nr:DUF6033 family protein [Lachnospiraceae bacterium]